MQIKREIPIPYYYQIEKILEKEIQDGKYIINDFLPSERELSSDFSVSKITVRKALSNLEFKGLIKKVKGRGSIVSAKKIEGRILNKLIGTFKDLKAMGLDIRNEILNKTTVQVSAEIAHKLNLDLDEEVLNFERLRFINEEPYQYSNSYIPKTALPGFDPNLLINRSLYEIIESQFNLKIMKIRRTIDASIASAFDAELFKIKEGYPILAFENIAYVNGNKPIEFSYNRIRGDLSKFQIDIVD